MRALKNNCSARYNSRFEIAVFSLGIFSIRNSNLHNFKVNGNIPNDYIEGAMLVRLYVPVEKPTTD